MPNGPSQPPLNVPPFRVVLEKEPSFLFPAAGILHSPRLDPQMHGGYRAVGIAFLNNSDEGWAGQPVIDSFHTASLIEYLTTQSTIRRAIESALDDHRVAWSLENLSPGRGVWKLVRIATLLIESPPTRGTRTAFTAVLGDRRPYSPTKPKDRPWDDGHDRHCLFRNGRFHTLNIEG